MPAASLDRDEAESPDPDSGSESLTGAKRSSAARPLGATSGCGFAAAGPGVFQSTASSSSDCEAETGANWGTPTMAKTGIAANGAIINSNPRGPLPEPGIAIDLHVGSKRI